MNKISDYWLCNYTDNTTIEEISPQLENLWTCNWSSILKHPYVSEIFTCICEKYQSHGKYDDPATLFSIAISSLQAFVQDNFLGPSLGDNYHDLKQHKLFHLFNMENELSVDGENPSVNITNPELLVLCKYILKHLLDTGYDGYIVEWWYIRYLFIHHQILEEATHTLYSEFFKYCDKVLQQSDLILCQETKALLLLEITQGFLAYRRIWKGEEHLNTVKKLLNANFDVKGFLGKRTKYQEKALPQLMLRVNFSSELPAAKLTHKTTVLPPLLKLNDDVRLEKITFLLDEDNKILKMPSIIQLLVLTTIQFIQQSQPKDTLADEELAPYMTTLLYQENGPWMSRIVALLLNIQLESNHKRTVDRSLKQCEDVLNYINGNNVPIFQRFSYAYASFIRPRWVIQAQLGKLMISLGLIKTALDIFLQIQKWEDVISCYTILDLRNKAAEIIQQELSKKPTVELLCLLGDATDDVSCYEQAWEISQHRSGRAQRHWGCYYFAKKDYLAAIPHLQKSLEINSLQENVWTRLGFAALTLENWELAAMAYRRYTNIEPNGFESWNNLAKAYINLGDKRRAHKVLTEALKCNFNNWKVWENFLIVSTDTGHFEDVINAFNQLIELKGKYYDNQVLEILVNSIANNIPDANGKPTEHLTKKAQSLIGHLCAQLPNEGQLWEHAAKLSTKEPLAQAHKLQKAYRCYTQTQMAWSKNPNSCAKILEICKALCEASLRGLADHKDSEKSSALSQLSSARLSAQGSIRAASDEKWDNCVELISELNVLLENIRKMLSMNL